MYFNIKYALSAFSLAVDTKAGGGYFAAAFLNNGYSLPQHSRNHSSTVMLETDCSLELGQLGFLFNLDLGHLARFNRGLDVGLQVVQQLEHQA